MARYIIQNGKPVEISKETEAKARKALETDGVDAMAEVLKMGAAPAPKRAKRDKPNDD